MIATEYSGMGPIKTGIPQAVRGLSEALVKKGHRVSVVMPMYEEYFSFCRKVDRVSVPFEGEQFDVDVYHVEMEGDSSPDFYLMKLPIVRLVNPLLEDNEALVDKRLGLFFSRAAVALMEKIGGEFDLAHAHTGVDFFAYFARARGLKLPSVYTLHNLERGRELGFSGEEFNRLSDCPLSGDETIDPYIFAMNWSDRIVTVSEKYAEELKFGKTLHQQYVPVIAQNAAKLSGIMNGLEDGFTPEALFQASLIHQPFSAQDLSGKEQCHLYLQRQLNLPQDARIPIILWSQRLSVNKGVVEFLGGVTNQIQKLNIQIVGFGSGEKVAESSFHGTEGRFPEKVRFIRFNRRNVHYEPSFIAGADLVILPSHEEPCGLPMLKAMRLGTLPMVRPVGGLAQVVEEGVNGFVIPDATPESSPSNQMGLKLQEVYRRCAEDRPAWEAMQERAMGFNSSWDAPAEKYLAIYHQLAAKM
jgi:starch synthase